MFVFPAVMTVVVVQGHHAGMSGTLVEGRNSRGSGAEYE